MSAKKSVRCIYGECMLPSNNRKYLVQFLYLLTSVIFLLRDSTAFTSFAIMMYIFPILLDLTATNLSGVIIKCVRYFFIAGNGVMLVFCLSGLFGFLVDNGDSFSIISTAMLFPEYCFSKRILIWPMLIELVVPIILYYGSPTTNTVKAIKVSEVMVKKGGQK